eukprot:Gb_01763 [translate_table: standard]
MAAIADGGKISARKSSKVATRENSTTKERVAKAKKTKMAIATLKERSSSSCQAIAKYIEGHYKNGLPSHFKKLLNNQLRSLTEKGKLTQVKGCFELTDDIKKSTAVKAIKATSVVSKVGKLAPPKKPKVAT